eukprot:TRINITY_DN4809_c0_g1_i5.p1 TRINITY_DN4809_c0_g1~~TRINITY_DN4809_c0_g1_i5.p1  ORF type:complete len:196 (-),score=23.66 TRINITY_DN4809_c0_g1_i5:54-641(-)
MQSSLTYIVFETSVYYLNQPIRSLDILQNNGKLYSSNLIPNQTEVTSLAYSSDHQLLFVATKDPDNPLYMLPVTGRNDTRWIPSGWISHGGEIQYLEYDRNSNSLFAIGNFSVLEQVNTSTYLISEHRYFDRFAYIKLSPAPTVAPVIPTSRTTNPPVETERPTFYETPASSSSIVRQCLILMSLQMLFFLFFML